MDNFKQELLDLAVELGLTPIPVRGRSQCAFSVVINGVPVTLWVGHYPGFAKDKAYKWQASLSTEADATRWGLKEEGVREFLKSSLVVDAVPLRG